jgi:hypothetical protein
MPNRRRYGVLNNNKDKTASIRNPGTQFTQESENVTYKQKGEGI